MTRPGEQDGEAPEGTVALLDGSGTGRVGAGRADGKRACGSGGPCPSAPGGGRRGALHRRSTGGWASIWRRGGAAGGPVQPRGACGDRPAPWRGATATVRPGRAGADPARVSTRAGSRAGRDGDLVADDAPSGVAAGARRTADGQHGDDPGHLVGSRVSMAARSDVVPHRAGSSTTEGRHRRRRHRHGGGPQKELIERAYRVGEALGLQVWCQDEAGPYQAIPQPGPSWQAEGSPSRRSHEYLRGGTAKLLTLFRPATGEVRAEPVEHATNALLHPWLKQELTAILDDC